MRKKCSYYQTVLKEHVILNKLEETGSGSSQHIGVQKTKVSALLCFEDNWNNCAWKDSSLTMYYTGQYYLFLFSPTTMGFAWFCSFHQKIIVKKTHQMHTCAHIRWYLMKFLKAPLKMKLEKICKTFHVAESWPIKSWVFLKGAMKRTSSLLHNINPALKMTKIMNNHTIIFINHEHVPVPKAALLLLNINSNFNY